MRKILAIVLLMALLVGITTGCSDSRQGSSDSHRESSEDEPHASTDDEVSKEEGSPIDTSVSVDDSADLDDESTPPAQSGGSYEYDLGYSDGRIFECCVNVDDYIYEKDGVNYVDLLEMVLDLGWSPREDNFLTTQAVYRYDGSNEGVNLYFTGQENHTNGLSIYPNIVAFNVTIESDDKMPVIDKIVGAGLLSSDENRPVYVLSTNKRMCIDRYSLVLYAYCLDHLRYGTELPVSIN